MNNYYTYAYLREDGTPYYIGKGKGKRAYSKVNRKVKVPIKNKILFLKKNLTEKEAFRHEIYMIAVFGRKDLGTGILRNLTAGGEGSSGAVRKKEFKDNLKKINTGKKLSKKHKEKLKVLNTGKNNPNYGKKASESTKQKMSLAHLGEKHHKSCWWLITFFNGENIKICGLNTWCKKTGYSAGNVYMIYSGKRKFHKDIIGVKKIDSLRNK